MVRLREERSTATTEAADVPVVALVCSAGGLDALSRILRRLPATFHAAVIVLRHHTPHAPNRLAPMLQTHTVLPVAAARDGDRIVAGQVLVAPAGFHTLVTAEGTIALVESGERPPYRPFGRSPADQPRSDRRPTHDRRRALRLRQRRRHRRQRRTPLRRRRHRQRRRDFHRLRHAAGHHQPRRDHRPCDWSRRDRRPARNGGRQDLARR